ncbi:MAG: hypothetical protein ACTSR0_03960 [Candidatus Asgardarchaeia archaeon]
MSKDRVIDPKEIIGAEIINAKLSRLGVIYLKLRKDNHIFTVAVDGGIDCSNYLVELEDDSWVWKNERRI